MGNSRISERAAQGMRAFLAIVLLAACGTSISEVPTAADTVGVGLSCLDDSRCSSGMCLKILPVGSTTPADSYCSEACTASCPQGMVCAAGPGGSKVCMKSCAGDRKGVWACVNGAPLLCSAADPTYCAACGCATDLRCDPGKGCVAKSDVDGPCLVDADCTSGNCSATAKVCRVALFAACTTQNCDACWTEETSGTPTGYTACSRECVGTVRCGTGQTCRKHPTLNKNYCYQTCKGTTDTCTRGTCTPVGSGSMTSYYCDCTDCKLYVGEGCASSSDCGATAACVDVPCTGDAGASRCGKMCLPTCTADGGACATGTCRALPAVEAGTVDVCDPRP